MKTSDRQTTLKSKPGRRQFLLNLLIAQWAALWIYDPDIATELDIIN